MTTTVTQTVGGGTLTVTPKVKPYNEIQNFNTFAVIKSDGSVITWGHYGTVSNVIASELNGTNDVVQIFSSAYAFAALRVDGSVVTWYADLISFGNNAVVKNQLNGDVDVKKIISTSSDVFAALRADGSVVTWGSSGGGDSSSVANKLNGDIDVVNIYSNTGGFAALRIDGSVITWGDSGVSDSSKVANQLLNVKSIFSTAFAFAAIKEDGSVVTWGASTAGGDSSGVFSQINGDIDVVQIYSNATAFAALRVDGTVVTWGNDGSTGGNSSAVAQQLIHVKQIFSMTHAFAALKEDGSIVTWGLKDSGDNSKVSSLLNGNNKVVQVFSTGSAFAALREDGSVVTWGSSDGGDSSAVANKLNGDIDVVNIYSNAGGFAALRIDGSVVSWGQSEMSDSSKVANQLDGTIDVIQVATTQTAFAAIRIDGSVVTWGYGPAGGDSSKVASQISSGVVSFADASTDDVFLASSGLTKVNHLPTGIVSVNGIAKTGQILTSTNTLSDIDGLGVISYQWLRSGSVISGANQSSYTLTSNDVNASISVKASYTDGLGTQEAVTSSATAIITSSNIAPTGYATASLTNGTKNTSYTIYASTLLQGFSDADGDLLTVTNLSATNGSISNNGNNTWTLTPNTNFVGTISLNYSVTDSKSIPIAASQSLSVIQNQVPPTGTVNISGTTQQYQTLYANNALADTNGLGTINYQWLSNSNVISGANQNSYILTQTEVGKTITVTASYIDGLGKLESMTSSATNSVTNVNDLPKGAVYINGKPNQAQVLTASNDISDLDGLGAINYQWLRSGSLINGANQSSYTLTANDVNSSISVKASYTDSYGTTESVTSSSITAQPPAQTPPTGSVIINGASQQNQTLTVSQSLADINGLGPINYEWLRNDNIISGATQISYTLTQADVGKAITVRTSYTDGLGKLESVTSSPTSPVVNVNDLSTGSVTISGEAKQGRIFTASNNIADADGLGTISYQWLRNGEIISNANNSSYTLTQADANQSLSVKASYMDGQGTREYSGPRKTDR